VELQWPDIFSRRGCKHELHRRSELSHLIRRWSS
jgi:hypothetical protein